MNLKKGNRRHTPILIVNETHSSYADCNAALPQRIPGSCPY
jgi:hypothetical protein